MHMSAATRRINRSRRAVRRRLVRWLGVFLVIQGLTAWLVSTRSKRAVARREAQRPDTYPHLTFESVDLERGGDTVRLYMHGEELLDDIVAAIDSAQRYVYVETFIWIDDDTGRMLIDALARASERGVRCTVMYDWLLSTRGLDERLREHGITTFVFHPMDGPRNAVRPGNVLRDHRKLVIVDGETSFVGGYNFGDEYLGWRDTHLRITGDSTHELENAFVDFFNQQRSRREDPLPSADTRSWDPHIVIHRNDPSLGIFPIRGMYLETIDRAERRIFITNAYFVPDRAFRTALEDAARRGVDVRILLPQRSNHPLTDALAHGMFEDLLGAGARVFLYRDFMVHAKTMTIDGVWSTVGTANLDRWSMLGNYEVNAEVRSAALAAQMEQMFELDCEHAIEVMLDTWRRRPLRMRAAERTLRSLAPLM